MDGKIIELAHLRNMLSKGRFDEEEKEIMTEIKEDIFNTNSCFKELALYVIGNCEEDLKNKKFMNAAQELQLIHNLPFYKPSTWNVDYFYKIELPSYLDNTEDVFRFRKMIILLGEVEKNLVLAQQKCVDINNAENKS